MLSEKLKTAGNGTASTLYVDDVFSTWLYTGNGSTQTITNGIDLSTNGGLVWIKSRSAATDHKLTDTVRGVTKALISDTTAAQTTDTNGLTTFSSTGFSIGTDSVYNTNAATYASWTFRKAAKFFDVQTISHTNGTANTIDLSALGTVGTVIAKNTTAAQNWCVWHRSLTAGNNLVLNTTAAQSTTNAYLSVSGTTATLSASAPTGTYVIYAYAHDTASTGIIQCGSFTGTGAVGNAVNLGWEPQWVLIKQIDGTDNWFLIDSMRGMPVMGSCDNTLYANSSIAEYGSSFWGTINVLSPLATGFALNDTGSINSSGKNYIYIAIRRPNKPPTSGTQVFSPVARSGTGATGASTAFGNVTDLVFTKQRDSTQTYAWTDRLRGATLELTSASSQNEIAYTNDVTGFDTMTGFLFGSGASGQVNTNLSNYIDYLFKRAPTFFDVVCYTGNDTPTNQNHNLSVAPEMIISKMRDSIDDWYVNTRLLGNGFCKLNATSAYNSSFTFISAVSTSTFTLGSSLANSGGQTYVAYLFATVAGISKVGSYTGNGTTQTINCGFSTGARFVLIKRTDSTGDWYTFDTARGMTTLTDPYLLLNSTAAETATLGAVTTTSVGFAVNFSILAAINTNAATYIYLAIA